MGTVPGMDTDMGIGYDKFEKPRIQVHHHYIRNKFYKTPPAKKPALGRPVSAIQCVKTTDVRTGLLTLAWLRIPMVLGR